MYDIIIIGAGPAGLTASIYGRRANKQVLILEATNYGGKIINVAKIDNYPGAEELSGFDLATKMYKQAKSFDVEIKFEKVLDINNLNDVKEVITKDNKYIGKTVIIATGTNNRKLNIENEKEFIGKGISYCATCDGAFYKNKIVAVYGGGNTALESALYLASIANKVYLIYHHHDFKADSIDIEQIKNKKNIEIINDSKITKLNGKDKLESIEINNKKNISVDGLFVAIGQIPENNNFAKYVELNEFGYIVANENCHTKTEGIFVAGDNREKELRQLVTATSDGAIAATEAIKYINNKKN